MGFTIHRSADNHIGLVHLEDGSTGARVSVAPEHGALLHAFSIETVTGSRNIIDHYAGSQQLQEDLALSFKSSKLSPFVCRIRNGKYTYGGKLFELQNKFIDGTAIHGLLYNKAFAIIEADADDNSATLLLQYHYQAEDMGYPFRYRCNVRYTLQAQQVLQVQTIVSSLDAVSLPIADGWHPYFTLCGKVNDWLLYFNASAMLEFDDALIPTGRLVPYTGFSEERPVRNTELDNCFLLHPDDNSAACTLRNPANGLTLAVFPDNSYPYLQIYTPPHRNSIAIENLSAAPDAFNNNMGLTVLAPGQSKTFTVHYQLSCT